MSLIDDHFRKTPEYYNRMYLDGFTPEEIMFALHRKMNRETEEREASGETPPSFDEVKIKSEVKMKK